MRAFLSHSSKDKGFVEAVAEQLRPGTFELDSQTFDSGLLNSQAILKALKQSDLFCLFLSKDSVKSGFVNFETLLSVEFYAQGTIRKLLVICLDNEAFDQASVEVKYFSIVRRSLSVESAARLIQGNLISASTDVLAQRHPFMGREEEEKELRQQVVDHERPPIKALYISGNYGAGRRTLARKFYESQFPHVGRVFPAINVEPFSGAEELFRAVLAALRPSLSVRELTQRTQAFSISSNGEKYRQIADLLNSLLAANEAAILVDRGGVLTDSGALQPELNEVVSLLSARPHPPVVFISPRMIPKKLRRPENDLAYVALKSLKRTDGQLLLSGLLKDREVRATADQLEELLTQCDGHPFNFYRLADEVEEIGVGPFLANPSDFIDWKHRQSSEYLAKLSLGEEEVLILALLGHVDKLLTQRRAATI